MSGWEQARYTGGVAAEFSQEAETRKTGLMTYAPKALQGQGAAASLA